MQLINAILCYINANFPTVSLLFTNALKMVVFVGSRFCDLIRDHGLSSCYCCAAFQNPLFYLLSLFILFSKIRNFSLGGWKGIAAKVLQLYGSYICLVVKVNGTVAKRFSCWRTMGPTYSFQL